MTDVNIQTEEARRAELSRAAPHGATATGQALHKGEEDDRLSGHPRGALQEPESGPEGGDFGEGTPAKPRGLQAEEATYIHSGTVPPNMVSSPGGLVPVGAVPESERDARLQTTLGKSAIGGDRRKLTEDEVAQIDGPSIRAIGVQRGYRMDGQFGSRSARAEFLRQQEDDQAFKPKKGLVEKVKDKVGV